MRMIQRGHGAGFALEAFGELLLRNFDGDFAIEARVARAIHFAHAPGAERRQDLIRSQAIAGGQGHEGFLFAEIILIEA